jgi:ABC-type cobalamin transport system permease subunit
MTVHQSRTICSANFVVVVVAAAFVPDYSAANKQIYAVPLVITAILSTALILLLDETETLWVCVVLAIICVVVPTWKFYLQRYKVQLRGPWDIAHV